MTDLTPLSAILRRYMQDLESGRLADDARHSEQTYRRGYHQGYDQAIEDIFYLLKDEHMSINTTYALVALQVNLIGIWRIEDVGRFILPPRLEVAQLLETLEYRRGLQAAEER